MGQCIANYIPHKQNCGVPPSSEKAVGIFSQQMRLRMEKNNNSLVFSLSEPYKRPDATMIDPHEDFCWDFVVDSDFIARNPLFNFSQHVSFTMTESHDHCSLLYFILTRSDAGNKINCFIFRWHGGNCRKRLWKTKSINFFSAEKGHWN